MSTPFTDGLRAYADALDAQSITSLYPELPTPYTHLVGSLAEMDVAALRFGAKVIVSAHKKDMHYAAEVRFRGLTVRFVYIEDGGAR